MDEYDVTGWDQDLIDELYSAPSDELYAELSETQLMRNLAHSVTRSNMDILFTQEAIDEYLAHYGTPRHSGRYPYGSGKNPQRSRNWLQRADDLAAQGLTTKEIATAFGLSSGDYISMRKIHSEMKKVDDQQRAIKLFNKGLAKTTIAEELGVSEGTVRNYLDPSKKRKESRTTTIANELKELLKEKPFLDLGEGVPRQLGISDEQMRAVRLKLQDEGYNVYQYDLPQVTNPTQKTKMLILCDGSVSKAELKANIGKVTTPQGLYFEDFGDIVSKLKPIPSVDSKRIKVVYDEDGGGDKDGLIEIRPGTDDLSLGGRNYAQVRVAVDGTHYLKGMAVYGDPKKMPPDVDIVFNTSKHKGTPVMGEGDDTVLKVMKNDPQNPFGSSFRQWSYEDSSGHEVTSPINIVNDDTDWDKWKKNLSSQFLSKQRPAVAKKQLDIRYGEMADEFDDIRNITNPFLKCQLLDAFADQCDSAAVHLKAAAFPRQGAYAILPVTSLKDNEVYAPMFTHGEEVILVRHPHEGTFQIPRLIVNNDNRDGKRMIGPMAEHAIGITPHSANQLSGADYDGDTVLVIPTKGLNLKSDRILDGLANYNPSDFYSRSPDDPIVTGKSRDGKKGDGFNKGIQMGMASNLITDMTIKGADFSEIERAVKHSMCVIDAEKHNLDWKRSYDDNGIAELKREYQLRIDEDGNEHTGASTLISRARGPIDIPDRKQVYSFKDMTADEKQRYLNGEMIYRDTGKMKKERKKITDLDKMTQEEKDRAADGEEIYRNTGKVVPRTIETTNMTAVKDAYELSSGYLIENIYADHANRLKALANEARKEMRATGKLEENKSAKLAYDDVVGKNGSLTKKIELAEIESPKDRQAQAIANSLMQARIQADPSLKSKDNKDKRKKLAAKALENARDAVNGGVHKKRYQIELTDREWEAIQAGAISENKFKTVYRYADKTELRKRATPRERTSLKASTRSRARMLLNKGLAIGTVANELGISATVLARELNIPEETNVGGD